MVLSPYFFLYFGSGLLAAGVISVCIVADLITGRHS